MPFTTPTPRTTGDLITAAVWNDEIAANLTHLHARQATLALPPVAGSGPTTAFATLGRWNAIEWDANSSNAADGAAFPFVLPTDFAALAFAHIYAVCDATTTITYDLLSRAVTPDTDLYTAGGAADLGATKSMVANRVTTFDATALLSGAAAGQVGTLALRPAGGTGSGFMYALLCVIAYSCS